ncbi:hypothetical protein RsTz2092_00960 [Deferribacterales bacterium RsTz2092]|nr:hypothetical protein AGMMS49941_00850 [Deferribacterales bacterium]
MAGRKNDVLARDLPVDKLDRFIRTNYKNIIIGAGALVLAVALIYGGVSLYNGSRAGNIELIGAAERAISSTDALEGYAELANKYSFAKDYIRYVAGASFVSAGMYDRGLEELGKVGGSYKAFAKSLLVDLDVAQNIASASDLKGEFAPLWYYRGILSAEGVDRTNLLAQFRANYPDSVLLAQLDRWGIR